jgi:hypothetical protein
MKKKIFYSIIILITGIIVGRNIYLSKTTQTFSNKDIYYFIQEGVYSSKSIMEENIKNMDLKVVDEIDNKYYVYLGITKDENIAKKLKEIYESLGYQIYIKELSLSNEEFNNNVTQFDLLINASTSTKEILTIEKVVLANYEEIIKKNI